MNVLIVVRDKGSDTTQLAEEVSESLVSFADLDADGVLDVLVVESDESSILPRVFSLGAGATRELRFELPSGVSTVAVLRDLVHDSECVAIA